jgi:hypothetical protein
MTKSMAKGTDVRARLKYKPEDKWWMSRNQVGKEPVEQSSQ